MLCFKYFCKYGYRKIMKIYQKNMKNLYFYLLYLSCNRAAIKICFRGFKGYKRVKKYPSNYRKILQIYRKNIEILFCCIFLYFLKSNIPYSEDQRCAVLKDSYLDNRRWNMLLTVFMIRLKSHMHPSKPQCSCTRLKKLE